MVFVALMAVIVSVMASPVSEESFVNIPVSMGKPVSTKEQVLEIVGKLLAANDLPNVKVVFTKSKELNAAAYMVLWDYYISIDQGMYSSGLGEQAVAAIIGHELTHISEGDVKIQICSVACGRAQEERADKKGIAKAEKAGYSKAACGAYQFFTKMYNQNRGFWDSKNDPHPSDLVRQQYSLKLCKKELDKPK